MPDRAQPRGSPARPAARRAWRRPEPSPYPAPDPESERAVQAAVARQHSLDSPLVPPQYRGRTWDQPWGSRVIQSIFPPLRWEPQGPLTDEFLDFQRFHGERMRWAHPEYFCVRCKARFVSRTGNVCGPCRAAEIDETPAAADPDGLGPAEVVEADFVERSYQRRLF